MRKIIFSLLALMLLLTAEARAEDAPRFKVGFILSMTGPWAEYGEAQRNALELARRERPELFKEIEFIYEDCGYSGRNAVSAFQKLRG